MILGDLDRYMTEIVNVANFNVATSISSGTFTIRTYYTEKKLNGKMRLHLLCTKKGRSETDDVDNSEPKSETMDDDDDDADIEQELSPPKRRNRFLDATMSGEVQFKTSSVSQSQTVPSDSQPLHNPHTHVSNNTPNLSPVQSVQIANQPPVCQNAENMYVTQLPTASTPSHIYNQYATYGPAPTGATQTWPSLQDTYVFGLPVGTEQSVSNMLQPSSFVMTAEQYMNVAGGGSVGMPTLTGSQNQAQTVGLSGSATAQEANSDNGNTFISTTESTNQNISTPGTSASVSSNQSVMTLPHVPDIGQHGQNMKTTHEVLFELSAQITDDGQNILNICRENVLDGGFRSFSRKSFCNSKKLGVRFLGEDGIDEGGLRREFMTLALKQIKGLPLLPKYGNLQMHSQSLQDNLYYKVGHMLAYCAVHGSGAATQVMSQMLYDVVAGKTVTPVPADCSDLTLKQHLIQIQNATSAEEFDLAVSAAWEWVSIAGCTNMCQFSPETTQKLTRTMCHFFVVDHMHLPLHQLMTGLKTLGVLDAIHNHTEAMTDVFVHTAKQDIIWSSDIFNAVFAVKWSVEGSNRKKLEQKILGYWCDFLQDIEDGENQTEEGKAYTFQDLLMLITGMETVPFLGFDCQPVIAFNHPHELDDSKKCLAGYPLVNTCALEIKLPISQNYDSFKVVMSSAITKLDHFSST